MGGEYGRWRSFKISDIWMFDTLDIFIYQYSHYIKNKLLIQKLMMLTPLKAAHMALSVLFAFIFIFCQIEVIQQTFILATFLIIFLLIFMAYGVRAYIIFHSPPGTQQAKDSNIQIGVQNIYQYQTNEQRRTTILNQLKTRGLGVEYLQQLQQQLIFLYARTSFCQICKFIKKPRTHHCYECGKCILRKQFHSRILDTCVGEKNLKNYIQYVATLFFVCFYMSFSSVLTALIYEEEIEEWGWLRRSLYFGMCVVCLGGVGYLGVHIYQIVDRLRKNITWEEAKIGSFYKKNPFSEEDYWSKLFPTFDSFIETNYRSEEFDQEMASSDRLPVVNF